MKQSQIEKILQNNYISCDPEESWNACSDIDKYGYIDVAIVFNTSPDIKQVFGDLINSDAEKSCWVWALATSKGCRSYNYNLAGMESAPFLDGRTALAKALRRLYNKEIKEAKKQFYYVMKAEER